MIFIVRRGFRINNGVTCLVKSCRMSLSQDGWPKLIFQTHVCRSEAGVN